MDQSQEVRSPAVKELPLLLEFLNGELRPKATWSISQEYPSVFQTGNLHNLKILTDQHEVLAHAGMKTFVVKTPLVPWKAAGLGNVITHPNYRQQGLSTKVIEACLNEARNQGVDFVILWSGLHDFYRKFGFELVGFEEHLTIPVGFRAPSSENMNVHGLRFIEGNRVCPEAFLKLYNAHTLGVVRTVEEIKKFLEIPNSRVWTAWDSANQLKAYAVSGKGLDLQGFVHEWGGSVSVLMALFEKISKETQKPFKVISPATSVNLISALLKRGATAQLGFLGMIKIINLEGFLSKLTRAAYSLKLELRFSPILKDGREGIEMEYLRSGQTLFRHLFNSSSELAQFVFGPVSWSQPSVPAELKSFFPLPLWFWGWDSV